MIYIGKLKVTYLIFRVDWQLPSDASSTDSELEEIFGDCFKFTRPKGLIAGNTSQDGTPSKPVRHSS